MKNIRIAILITGLLILSLSLISINLEEKNEEEYNFCENFYKSSELINKIEIECKEKNNLGKEIIKNKINNCQSIDTFKI